MHASTVDQLPTCCHLALVLTIEQLLLPHLKLSASRHLARANILTKWEKIYRDSLRCANNFKPGHIQLPELREALGLDDTLVSERKRLRRADELPWFAGEFARGDGCLGLSPRILLGWEVCPSKVRPHAYPDMLCALDPTEMVMNRIVGDQLPLTSPPLKIFGEDGDEEYTDLRDASEANTSKLGNDSETRVLPPTKQPKRLVVFQWSPLPVSQAHTPPPALLDTLLALGFRHERETSKWFLVGSW